MCGLDYVTEMGGAQRGWVREGAMPPPAQPGGMGERCKLPHRGLGLRPRSFAIRAIFMFKSLTKFDHFSLIIN